MSTLKCVNVVICNVVQHETPDRIRLGRASCRWKLLSDRSDHDKQKQAVRPQDARWQNKINTLV